MSSVLKLVAGTALAVSGIAMAQTTTSTATQPDGKVVEGATAERERLIAACTGHKFETTVVLDAAKNRTTKVKLCSEPGATDADWIKTLKSAVTQIEQRRMPPTAKQMLLAELKGEIARFQAPAPAIGGRTASASPPPIVTPPVTAGDRFETSTLPSLERRPATPAPAERFEVAALPPLTAPKAGAAATPPKAMSATVRCLERGDSGAGMTCDFLQKDTVLAIRAGDGLDKGARLRFVRRGDERGEVTLAALAPGATTRVRLPSEVCTGVKSSKLELQLLAPGSTAVSTRLGPFGLRC